MKISSVSVSDGGVVIVEIEGVNMPILMRNGEKMSHRTVDGEERISLKRQGTVEMVVAIARVSTCG